MLQLPFEPRDAHWFGGKLPSKVRSIENVTASAPGSTPGYTYQRLVGAPPAQADAERTAFIVAERASIVP